MKTLFIVNPVAGRNNSVKIWNDIKPHITYSYDFILTKAPGEATRIAQNAARQGFTRVVAVGGDGTVSEVVNGIVRTDTELGIIPAGSGNDTVKTLEIPPNPIDALAVIKSGYSRKVDIGKYDRGYFINVAGAGFDAETLNTNKNITFLSGSLAYIASVLWTLIRYSPRKAKVKIDGKIYNRKLWLAVVANGQYFGGGIKISPDARIDDGLFDICLVGEISRLEIIKFLPKVFSGGHKDHKAFEVIRGKDVQIEFETATAAQVDGEIIGFTPVTFSILPKALKVIRNNFTSA
ncbi:MAG: diacylglycerol kinase family lipid kinase [Thermoanaerobacteraceae bacterium]|nr:diacylglycerol kinase family lipid kinase [Thermoanaerobacteraceae bacterium]